MKQYAAVEMRRVMLALVIGLVAAALAAGTAFAGEITGNGEETAMRGNANSECGFSGLDDADDDGFEHTQNWGQLSPEARAFLASIGVAPWTLCNGHLSPQK
jgi:hypothetical protein